MTSCTTHHNACACREHKVSVLIKSGLDVASHLDGLQMACADLDEESRGKYRQAVERVYDACGALGVEIGANEQQRRVIGCKRLDGGADCYSNLGCKGCQNAIYEGQAANQNEVPA